MEILICKHFVVIEKFIAEFNESQSLFKEAHTKRQRMKAEYKMDLVILNFEIYTSKYPEVYQFLVKELKDDYQQRLAWDSFRVRENFLKNMKVFLQSISIILP